jgi:hypothetical protein
MCIDCYTRPSKHATLSISVELADKHSRRTSARSGIAVQTPWVLRLLLHDQPSKTSVRRVINEITSEVKERLSIKQPADDYCRYLEPKSATNPAQHDLETRSQGECYPEGPPARA